MNKMIKTLDEIKKLEVAGQIVAQTLSLVKKYIKPGISTFEIDKVAEDFILSKNAYPTFKGYKAGSKVFPNALCISINEEIIHGIPSKNRILQEGDIVSIDCGSYIDGYNGDSAVTYACGAISEDNKRLMQVTEESLMKGIAKAVSRNKLFEISKAVENHVKKNGFSVNRDYTGHGIGQHLHEEPSLPNFVPPLMKRDTFPNVKLFSGMAIAIEPMVHTGTHKCVVLDDGWTVVTKDRLPAAHFEHTVVIQDNKPIILTLRD